MNTDIAMDRDQKVAAVATMMLAACADDDLSKRELARLKDVLASATSWVAGMDSAEIEALVEAAQERTRAIFEIADNDAKLRSALSGLAQTIGEVERREVVLALAQQVAAADGLDDDEKMGMQMLIAAFGANAVRVAKLAG